MLARSKAEALFLIRAYERESAKVGLVVKANCVLFEQNGQRSKFITNCYNLKDVLDQAREAENNGQKIFPVENVIVKRRSLGDGKSAYYFEE